MNSNDNIKNVIENKNLEMIFEPVVSVIKHSVIGFNVNSLGMEIEGERITMDILMKEFSKKGCAIELDRIYREKAIETFEKIYESNKEFLLFIKINSSVISDYVGSGIIKDLINNFDINPKNVVLEIIEDKIKNLESLKEFINTYRSLGFLVSLSDMGHGFSNLDKISYVEPDIIKISKAITENIEIDYYKQEVFKALVNLSKNIGALVIVEGIERYEQALTVIELGADMLEGGYFGSCKEIDDIFIDDVKDKVKNAAKQYEEYMQEKINFEKSKHKNYERIMDKILKELSRKKEVEFNDTLDQVIAKNDDFECIYILNDKGIQVSKTFTYYKNMLNQKALIFQPAEEGTNHSLKKYYYFLKNMGLSKYITEPYISLATGNLCTTISYVFENEEDKKYILCIDFNPSNINI